jgi:hypothetical protein
MDPPWVKPEERARKLNNPNNQKDPISATKNMESNDTIDHENSNYNIRPFEASNKSYEHLAPPQTTNFNPKEWRRK